MLVIALAWLACYGRQVVKNFLCFVFFNHVKMPCNKCLHWVCAALYQLASEQTTHPEASYCIIQHHIHCTSYSASDIVHPIQCIRYSAALYYIASDLLHQLQCIRYSAVLYYLVSNKVHYRQTVPINCSPYQTMGSIVFSSTRKKLFRENGPRSRLWGALLVSWILMQSGG